MNKYEKLIEHIINDNEQAARKLFHQIVVEKSRDIYESLMDEEMGGNQTEEMVDDITNEVEMDEEGLAEADEEFGDEENGEEEFDLDSTDDDEVASDHDEMGDEDLEDRVMDLESELEELQAEFARLMKGEEGEEAEEAEHPGIHDMDGADSENEFDSEEDEGEEEEMDEDEELDEARLSYRDSTSQVDMMREYVEKVKDFYKNDATEGEKVGAPSSDKTVNVNKKSAIAGKNDMGGTASNIVHGGANESPDGKQFKEPSNEYSKKRGDLPGAGKFQNVPGKNAKQEMTGKSYEKAREKEGKTVGANGSVPVNKKSEIGGKVR
jgi:hypothetical protein